MKLYSTVNLDEIQELKANMASKKELLEILGKLDKLTERVAQLESNTVADRLRVSDKTVVETLPAKRGRPRKVNIGEQQRVDSPGT